MILAISSTGEKLSDNLDTRFGRAKYFIIYDTKDSTFKAYNNNQNLSLAQGAGIQSAQAILDYNAEVLISGNCGPKAFSVLSNAGIKIYSAENCSVELAINSFLNNKLKLLSEANLEGN
jgi:predicted Fe-Mo cluster-binding NifX family protein